MRYGYVRVSTMHQDTARQEVLMKELGVDKVFIDKCTGKNTARPMLEAMFRVLGSGDVVVVESYSRMSRSTTAAFVRNSSTTGHAAAPRTVGMAWKACSVPHRWLVGASLPRAASTRLGMRAARGLTGRGGAGGRGHRQQ